MAASKDTVLEMYRIMVLIRRFEEKAAQAYTQGKITGFCHLYIGQEAVAAGMLALRKDDYIIGAYRDHAYPLVRGAHPGMIMAELFGRSAGYAKGKGGSMHIFDIEHACYGGYGIVGGQIPLATGMGFASKYRSEDRVTLCLYGDAAANQGAFYESLNMAAKWKLPVIYCCENNKYGMGTDIARVSAVPEIHKRASAFGCKGMVADGMDALEMYDAFAEAADLCRKGKGPVILEAMTYRFRGHSMADPQTYRTKDEIEAKKGEDPIVMLGEYIQNNRWLNSDDLLGIDSQAKAEAEKAVQFADQSPEPSMDDLHTDLLVAEGELDVKPRERVLGEQVKNWPQFPGANDFKVKWDLEPLPTGSK